MTTNKYTPHAGRNKPYPAGAYGYREWTQVVKPQCVITPPLDRSKLTATPQQLLRSRIADAKRRVNIKEASGHGRDNGIQKLKREYRALYGRRK